MQGTVHRVQWKEFEIKPGIRVLVDGNRVSRQIMEGDDWSTYRLESWHLPRGFPIEIEVTGRTVRMVNDNQAVRVRITTVNDGEPNESFGAYLYVG